MQNNLITVSGNMTYTEYGIHLRLTVAEYEKSLVEEKPTFYLVDFSRRKKANADKIVINEKIVDRLESVYVTGFFVDSDRDSVEKKAIEFIKAEFDKKMKALREIINTYDTQQVVTKVRSRKEEY